jgi:hypothetical protein
MARNHPDHPRRRTGIRRAAARLALLLAATGALALAGPARAEPGDGGARRDPPGTMVRRHAARLGLEGPALAAIEQIVRESGARQAAIQSQIEAARTRLSALLSEEVTRPDDVMAQAEMLGSLEAQERTNRLAAILKIRTQLTPAQHAELMRIRDEERAAKQAARTDLGACSEDLRAHCGSETAGAARLGCMQTHWKELSLPCQAALEARPAALVGSRN